LATPPVAEETSAKGMYIPGLEQLHFLTRFHILELNKVASLKFREHGLQVIDLYMSLQSLISKRKEDGIHWTPEANRLMTNKILTHICLVYWRPLPGRLQSVALQKLVTMAKGGDVKQDRTFQRELERESDLSQLLKLQFVKQESIENEIEIMRDIARSRSSHELLTRKIRRRVCLNKGRKKRRNVPQLDLVKRVVSKRKLTDEPEISHSLDSSNNVEKPRTEKPPESKRRKVEINNAKLPVNPFDLTSVSQPYTRNVKAQKKAKKMSRNKGIPLVQSNTIKPFQQNENKKQQNTNKSNKRKQTKTTNKYTKQKQKQTKQRKYFNKPNEKTKIITKSNDELISN
jgi:hypothetical protein